jgi:hypothetical protein
MMRFLDRFIFVAVCAALNPAAIAIAIASDSGEFPGVYVEEGSAIPSTAEDRELIELKCLLAPDTMHADGRGAGYYLDDRLFNETGRVSYVKAQSFNCRYAPEKRMETCESEEYSDKGATPYYRTNVYETFTSELQRGASLFTPEDVATWTATGKVNPTDKFAFHRCGCLSVAQIETLAQPDVNSLPQELTAAKRYWWQRDPSPEDFEVARKVRDSLGGCHPKLS